MELDVCVLFSPKVMAKLKNVIENDDYDGILCFLPILPSTLNMLSAVYLKLIEAEGRS